MHLLSLGIIASWCTNAPAKNDCRQSSAGISVRHTLGEYSNGSEKKVTIPPLYPKYILPPEIPGAFYFEDGNIRKGKPPYGNVQWYKQNPDSKQYFLHGIISQDHGNILQKGFVSNTGGVTLM